MKKIAGRFNVADWAAIDFSSSNAWSLATDIFLDRVNSRFLDPLGPLLHREGTGFVITAIHCLLIEMFEQFRRGVDETPRGSVKTFFTAFLTQPEVGFTNQAAGTFYEHIRCGLHHQGRTKKESLIKMTGPLFKESTDGSLVINRTKLHEKLVRWTSGYVQSIREGTDQEQRRRFRAKMESICT